MVCFSAAIISILYLNLNYYRFSSAESMCIYAYYKFWGFFNIFTHLGTFYI